MQLLRCVSYDIFLTQKKTDSEFSLSFTHLNEFFFKNIYCFFIKIISLDRF